MNLHEYQAKDLLAKYGVDAAGVVRGIERVLARKH